jgi:hypothetical protein
MFFLLFAWKRAAMGHGPRRTEDGGCAGMVWVWVGVKEGPHTHKHLLQPLLGLVLRSKGAEWV